MSRLLVAFALVLAAVACNSKSLKQGYCNVNTDCPSRMCNLETRLCSTNDGSVDKAEVGDAGEVGDGGIGDAVDGRDGSDVREVGPPRCTETSCFDGGYDGSAGVCELEAGVCVQCLTDSHCGIGSKTPICDARLCRACKTDAECPDPGICMTDGHCASDEVMFVDYGATSCPGLGSATSPYCTIAAAVGALQSTRNVIVIRGPADDKLILATTGVLPVVIGRKNTSGADASIPSGAGTAISVTSDQVLLRDLTATGATAATSKGIVVSGATTKLTLSNVRVTLTTDGVGVQADTGALLAMDHCTITNNKKGGILIDGASFDLENTTVSNNGPSADLTWGGIRIQNLITGPTQLKLLTIQGNNPSGVSCGGQLPASSATGVFATGNTSGDVSGSCGFQPCLTMSATCGAP